MATKRRIIRERVLQALYAYELSQEPIEFILENIVGDLKKQPKSFSFAKELILKTIECRDEFDTLIKKNIQHWEFNRLAIIDMIILRMGLCEFIYFEDIPPKVTLNEAIEIARSFSTDKSDKFVNGVLDSVYDLLKESGKIRKSGRGLINVAISKNHKK